MNNNLTTINQNSKLVLTKSKNLLDITNKLLSKKDSKDLAESFNSKPLKTVYKISTDQNKAIEFEDNIQAWVDADTALMWEVKTENNIEHRYVWSEEEIERAEDSEELTDDAKDAFSYAQKLNTNNHAGFSDWRVPRKEELGTLYTEKRNNSYHIKYPLSKTASSNYWSSTTLANFTGKAWIVGFSVGSQYYNNKTDNYYVCCVRAGQ